VFTSLIFRTVIVKTYRTIVLSLLLCGCETFISRPKGSVINGDLTTFTVFGNIVKSGESNRGGR
jgi:hypothetical protein